MCLVNDEFNKLFAERLIERAGKCADKFSTARSVVRLLINPCGVVEYAC